jgi:predicted RNA polymerase sigma factor
MSNVKLTGMQRAVASLYFEQGLYQHEVADALHISRQAVTMRIARLRRRFAAAGVTPPPRPGSGLRTVPLYSLSSFAA